MTDPYVNYPKNPEAPATGLVLITPTDGADLGQVVKALRIWNGEAADETIRVSLVSDPATYFDLTVPAGLTIENIRVARVQATGTTATLIIHGYTG